MPTQSWNTITTADVLAEFSAAEQSSLTGQAASGSLDTILANVVAETRGAITVGGNPVDQTGTNIPDSIRMAVVSVTRWRWISSIPMLQDFKTKDREDLYREGVETLNAVRSGRLRTEQPDNPADLALAPPSPVNSIQTASHQHRMTRHMKGVWF